MRFVVLIVQICKGIFRGVSTEVKKLAEQTRKNELMKRKTEEMNEEILRLGEYVYSIHRTIEDERIQLLCNTIYELQEEIERYKQEIRGE